MQILIYGRQKQLIGLADDEEEEDEEESSEEEVDEDASDNNDSDRDSADDDDDEGNENDENESANGVAEGKTPEKQRIDVKGEKLAETKGEVHLSRKWRKVK